MKIVMIQLILIRINIYLISYGYSKDFDPSKSKVFKLNF